MVPKFTGTKCSAEYRAEVGSVLDVGCSHGKGVSLLWERGFNASGCDISATAISRARSLRTHPTFCPLGSCFRVGSGVGIPFETQSFDALLSTDVIEHVLPNEVGQLFAEFRRVTKRLPFLQIANKKTCGNCTEYIKAYATHKRESGKAPSIPRVHATVMVKQAWVRYFEKAGLEIVKDILPRSQTGFDSLNNFNFVLRVKKS